MGDEEYQGIRRREINTAENIFPKIQLAERERKSSHLNGGRKE